MTGKQLKNSILQLAIQGKLVPQDPADEPASELLKRIRKEKELLVKEGKLKKKDLVSEPIADEDKPFEIPESWEWCRLGEVLSKLTDGSHNPPPNSGSGYPVISAMNVKNGKITFDNVQRFVSESDFQKENLRTNITKGDIIMGIIGGSIGNIAVYTHDVKVIAQRSIAIMRSLIDLYFTVLYLQSSFCQNQLSGNSSGSAQGGVYLGTLAKLLIPLPPLPEQHRIVAKIEELMPLVEEYDKAQTQLDALNASLPETLKKSILQQAIQGKLVPQDPNDEPASVLLKRIRKEKEQLVKEGKLKKKDLVSEPIADEDKPFEIPESWEWCRLGDLVSNRAGLAYNKGDLDVKETKMIRVLRGGNISFGRWFIDSNDVMIAHQFVNPELYLKRGTFITPAVTSLENMGKTALIEQDLEDTVVGGFVLMLQSFCKDKDLLYYLQYFFRSAHYKEYCKSITNKSGQAFYNISRSKLMEMLVPLPPLPEQHRIVAKIEELFAALK